MNLLPVDVLLVDDDARNLDALEAILVDPAYRLLRAQDADAALRLLLDHDVAVIVLDIQMPTISGFELAQMIKTTKRFRQTPILFLTAMMLDEQHVAAGYLAGAVDYLTKPLNPQILQQKIAVFADLFRKTRALSILNETLEERVKERTAELERSESALRSAAGQKDEFLAVLAHELRNPLAPLRMGVDLLISKPTDQSVVDRTLKVMNRQLDHMVRLIDDLLDVSRLNRGVLDLKLQRFDLRAVLWDTTETFKPILEQRQQSLELDLSLESQLDADPTRIAQVFGNLLHNATKFTPEGGTITVSLAKVGTNAVVRVMDSGIGIPNGQEENVFGMFARVPREEGLGQPGLGIGLALARRLTKMHGGTLEASSEGDNLGSTFTLTLPLASTALNQVPLDERAKVSSGNDTSRNVLIVEDNEDVADSLSDWLQERGHQVTVARNGRDAIALVQQVLPAVVLCDLGLPVMDGLEVCRAIRALKLSPSPFIVALTGWGRDDDRQRTKAAGFDLHLVKPVGIDDLEKALQTNVQV